MEDSGEECFKCGISDKKALLFDIILPDGLSKICRKCSFKENRPIIRKKEEYSFKRQEKKESVNERLSRLSGVDYNSHKPYSSLEKERELRKKQEVTLNDLVEKHISKKFKKQDSNPKDDLISNFHWIIVRMRRLKCLTQKQLADEIREPELAIKILEKGSLPNDYLKIIRKLEDYLRIRLMKKPETSGIETPKQDLIVSDEPTQEIEIEFNHDGKNKSDYKEPEKVLSFDPVTTKNLTLSDLKEMKRKKEAGILGDLNANQEDNKGESEREKEDISKDEMDDLIFGRK